MKVTTELKNLIKRNFDEKRSKVKQKVIDLSKKEYEEMKKEFENSVEYKNFVSASNALFKAFESQAVYPYSENKKPYYFTTHFKELAKNKVEDFISEDYYFSNKNQEKWKDEINKLDLEQESLMIKLTYERDLDKIRALLAEYDISI